MVLGIVSPLIALVVAGTLYLRRRPAVHPFLYWLAASAVGIVAGFFGMIKGAELACNSGAGNLCGLYGVFVTGPITFALAAIAVAFALSLCRVS